MKRLFIILFFLLSTIMWGQITSLDGQLPQSTNIVGQYGNYLVYADTSTSPWTFYPVFDSSGTMRIFNKSDYYLEVAKGTITSHSSENKFGHNPTITTGTDPEDVWSGGGIYNFYPDTSKIIIVVSDSSADTVGGAGALTAVVIGLDSAWNVQSETVVLAGSDSVALLKTYRRIYRAYVATAGSDGTNNGSLTFSIDQSVDTVAAIIAAGDGQTQQAIYTIPNNKTGYILNWYAGVSKGGGATVYGGEVKLKTRTNPPWYALAGNAWQTKGQIELITSGGSWWQHDYGIPAAVLPERTDIRIECVEVTGTLGIVGGFDIVLVDD